MKSHKSHSLAVACILIGSGCSAVNAAGYGGGAGHAGALQGIGTVGQGVAQIGSAAVNGVMDKADRFVDAAGTVYTVVKDVHGHATKFVMNSVGTVFDVTKMAGTFLVDAAASYPRDLYDSLNEGRKELQTGLRMGMDAAATLGKFAMNSMPELPPLNQFHKPSAWKNAAKDSYSNMLNAYRDIEFEVYDAGNMYEEKYCKPASFKPSVKKPTKIIMPGFFMEVGLGDCTVALNSTNHTESMLTCTKPYLKFEHKNGTFVMKHHTAPKFKSKECKHEKVFGEKDEIVLLEFGQEGHSGLRNMADMVGMAFGALTSSGANVVEDLQGFVGELHANKETLDDFVKGKADQLLSMESSYLEELKAKTSAKSY